MKKLCNDMIVIICIYLINPTVCLADTLILKYKSFNTRENGYYYLNTNPNKLDPHVPIFTNLSECMLNFPTDILGCRTSKGIDVFTLDNDQKLKIMKVDKNTCPIPLIPNNWNFIIYAEGDTSDMKVAWYRNYNGIINFYNNVKLLRV